MSKDDVARRLLAWFDEHGRHDLPWQQPREAYRVWLSEIMLQQTQVTTVIPYFERFVAAYPDVHALAAAPLDEVLHLWSGLGYYARGRNLHRTARIVSRDFGGSFPETVEGLSALPGIGESTAGAICAQAFDRAEAILDGNVKRVLARYHAVDGPPDASETKRQLWAHARTHTPSERVADYTQAIMDLGATVCRRRRPSCSACPLATGCAAHRMNKVESFPGQRRRRDKPVRATQMLVIREPGGAVLLEQRPAEGLWGGLWSLPEVPDGVDPDAACLDLTQRTALRRQRLPGFRHSFSHYHLDIQPVFLEVAEPAPLEDSKRLWYKRGQSRLGLAAPVARLLEQSELQTAEE
jgi:A/G-specific adenine glycosylase